MEGRANGRNPMEQNMTKFRTAGLALAGILAITAATATDASAQWRRHGGHGWGPAVGIGAGIAAGALIGSAVAARPYGYGGYGYYDEPVYAAPYAYDSGPTYYTAPVAGPYYGNYGYNSYGYSSNRCQEGYRRVACTQGGGF
jgi:hypothetical protein